MTNKEWWDKHNEPIRVNGKEVTEKNRNEAAQKISKQFGAYSDHAMQIALRNPTTLKKFMLQ